MAWSLATFIQIASKNYSFIQLGF